MRKAFSLFELIIVITIIGILYSIGTTYANNLKEKVNYESFIKYAKSLNDIGCNSYVKSMHSNNPIKGTNFEINIPNITYAQIVDTLHLLDNTPYKGKTIEGDDLKFSYENMSCKVKFKFPNKYINSTLIKPNIKITPINTKYSNVVISNSIKISDETRNILINNKINKGKGKFQELNNENLLQYINNNYNEKSNNNNNLKDYNSLNYINKPNSAIPFGQKWIDKKVNYTYVKP